MIPIEKKGYIKNGPLQGWWVKVQPHPAKGFMVIRSLNENMVDTVVFETVADEKALEGYFIRQGATVDWKD